MLATASTAAYLMARSVCRSGQAERRGQALKVLPVRQDRGGYWAADAGTKLLQDVRLLVVTALAGRGLKRCGIGVTAVDRCNQGAILRLNIRQAAATSATGTTGFEQTGAISGSSAGDADRADDQHGFRSGRHAMRHCLGGSARIVRCALLGGLLFGALLIARILTSRPRGRYRREVRLVDGYARAAIVDGCENPAARDGESCRSGNARKRGARQPTAARPGGAFCAGAGVRRRGGPRNHDVAPEDGSGAAISLCSKCAAELTGGGNTTIRCGLGETGRRKCKGFAFIERFRSETPRHGQYPAPVHHTGLWHYQWPA